MHQIQKLKFSSSLHVVVFVQYIKASCQVENEDEIGAVPTGDAPTISEWLTILLPTKVTLYYRFGGSIIRQKSNKAANQAYIPIHLHQHVWIIDELNHPVFFYETDPVDDWGQHVGYPFWLITPQRDNHYQLITTTSPAARPNTN